MSVEYTDEQNTPEFAFSVKAIVMNIVKRFIEIKTCHYSEFELRALMMLSKFQGGNIKSIVNRILLWC